MVIMLIVLLLFPLGVLIYVSVVRQWTYPQFFDSQFTFEHWGNTLGGQNQLVGSFFLSAGIALLIAFSCTFFGFVLSRYLMYSRLGHRLLALAYFPYLIAPVILGAMLQFYFIRTGLSGKLAGVLLAQFLFVFPYAVLFFSGFWNDRTRNLEGQAATLGASNWQILRKVLVPAGREWLVICFFQCFLISWFEYGITSLIGIGKVPTLTIQTMQYVGEANPYVAAVAACLMVLPLVALLAVNRKVFLRNSID